MKKLLILSFLLLNLKCLVAGDRQTNLSSLQFSELFVAGGKLTYSNKREDLATYFLSNQNKASSRDRSRASNLSVLSGCSSVGLSFENLKLDSQEQSFQYNLENGLEPENGYTSPIEELSKKNLENKFSPGEQKFSSPTTARNRLLPNVVNPHINKRIPKRGRSDSSDENDEKIRKLN
ncbi:MAG: hypothetical protein ACXWL2_02635 [Candidatus Chromulinivorax sp.]